MEHSKYAKVESLVNPKMQVYTHHHSTIFGWSKQITEPAEYQGETQETPQLTGKSEKIHRHI